MQQEQNYCVPAEVTGKNAVVLHNYFTNIPWGNFTVNELRMLFWIISKADSKNDVDFKKGKVLISELYKDVLGWKDHKNHNYEYAREICDILSQKKIVIKVDKENNLITPEQRAWIQETLSPDEILKDDFEIHLPIFSMLIISKGSSYIRYEISDKLKPFLLNLSKNFTKYDYMLIKALPSTYTIKTYTFILALLGEYKTNYALSLLDFKNLLSISHKTPWKEVNRTIERVKDAINEKTNVTINVTPIKDGRAVNRLLLEFKYKKDSKAFERERNRLRYFAENAVKELTALTGAHVHLPPHIEPADDLQSGILENVTYNDQYKVMALVRNCNEPDKAYSVAITSYEDVKIVKSWVYAAEKVFYKKKIVNKVPL